MYYNLLDVNISNDLKVRDATGIQFYQWILKKLDGVTVSNQYVLELRMLSSAYPSRVIDDGIKLEILNKMVLAGINLE